MVKLLVGTDKRLKKIIEKKSNAGDGKCNLCEKEEKKKEGKAATLI